MDSLFLLLCNSENFFYVKRFDISELVYNVNTPD